MKRVILTIALALFSVQTFAQLNIQTIQESRGYKEVYKMTYGEIRYADGIYYLCGSTSNRYEKSMASIILGVDKESALLSLEDLRKILYGEISIPKEGVVVEGLRGKETIIEKAIGGFAFKTEGVAGYSSALVSLKRFMNSAMAAVRDFEE